MKPPRVRWNTTEARVERFVRLAQRLELPVYGFEVHGQGRRQALDPFKFALSWATGRHPERMPVNYLHGILRFYEGADRTEIIWEDAEVEFFCSRAPELHADAVRLARETGLRIGDLVELERSDTNGMGP